MAITLYFRRGSRAERPRWLLEELEVPHELVRMDFERREHKAPEYRTIHPLGVVPALVDGEQTILESGAICMALLERFDGEHRLAPAPGAPGRAAFIQWMFFVTGSFEPALFPYLRHNVFTPEDERNADQAEATRVAFDEVLDVYDAALQPGPYMLGERFSAADIVTGQALNKAMGFSALDRHERLRDYVQRLRQRPAAIRALDLAGS